MRHETMQTLHHSSLMRVFMKKKNLNSREFSSDEVEMDFDMLVSSLHESSQGRATRRRPIKPKPKGEKISKRTKRIPDQDIHENVITSTTRQCDETRSGSGERIEDLQQSAAEFARAPLSKSLSLELAGRQSTRDEMGDPSHYRGKGWLLSAIMSFK